MPVTITRTTTLSNDIDGDGIVDPGEALTIRVRVTNATASDITSLQTFDSQNGITIDPASVKITPIAFDDTLPTITGNTPTTFSKAAILGNDVDPNDPSATFTVQLGAGTNGTIVDNGDGTLTFTPITGFTGTASFTYTVTNTHQGESSVSTATVSMNVSGLVWYVDSGYGGANGAADGSYLKPFTSLAALNGVTGDGTTNDDVDGAGDTIFVYDRGAAYSGGIVLEAGQKLFGDGHAFTVNGLTIGASASNATIGATTGIVVTLSTDNTIYGVTLNANGAGVTGLADGNGSVSSTTSSQGLIIGETSFTGAGKAIDIDQGGKLAVNIDSLSSSGSSGEAIQLAGTTASGTGLITGTFNVTTGTIAGATNQGVLIGVAGGGTAASGGDVNVTYGGAITSPTGSSVEIQDRTGGTVTFTGAITDTVGGAAGILVDGNAGTINFNNQINISNGAAVGVQVTNNSGTVNFNSTGTGLDITTTTGRGLVANGGGTLVITGAGNSITSAGGTALNVTGTTIGAGGLTFQSISANGAINGIVLDSTGSTAGLTVTGDAGSVNNSSGGTLQNQTGSAVVLTNTRGVSLDQLNIQSSAINGIDGTGVTNFAFTNGTINNSGLSGATSNASNIAFNDVSSGINNLSGTVTITGSTLNNAYNSGIQIYNESGTISSLNISNNNLNASGSTSTSKGSGIQIDINGSAGTAAAITAGTVNNNIINDFASGAGIQFQGGNGAQGPAVTLGTYTTTPGTGTLIQIANNQVGLTSAGTPMGTNGIAVGVTGTGQGNFSLTTNTVQHFLGQGIAAFGGNQANVSFNIDGNTVDGTDNIANSQGISVGSQLGGADATQTGTVRAIVNGNTVTGMEGSGIYAGITNSYNTGYFRITNNTVGNPQGTGFRAGIAVLSGSSVGDATVYLEISGNTSGAVGASYPGISLRRQGSTAGVNDFFIEGLPQSNATHSQAEQYVSSQNPNSLLGTGNDGSTPSRVLSVSGQGYNPGTVPFSNYVPVPGSTDVDGQHRLTAATYLSDGIAPQVDDRFAASMFAVGSGPAPTVAPVEEAPATLTGSAAPTETVPAVDLNLLTQARLDAVVSAAIARWAAAGASEAQLAAMRAIKVDLADMAGVQVGSTGAGVIHIDTDGGGQGWFVDQTPGDDSEFAGAGTRLGATADGGAAGRIDLLTVLLHELGHQIGLDDGYTPGGAADLMYAYINAGERRLPAAGEAAHGEGHAPVQDAYVLSPVSVLGTLPAGKAVDVTYVGTVNTPAGAGLIASLSNTASASSSSGTVTSAAEVTAVDSLTLGDRIFLDANKNGIFDTGDTGIAGVTLTLFADTNGNGVYDDGTDLAISYIDNNSNGVFDPAVDTPAAAGTAGAIALTVTTNASGIYSFGNLAAGDYIVRVNASNFTGGGALVGRRATLLTSDPDNNINNDSNATQLLPGQAGTYAVSQAITLSYNNEPTPGAGNDTNNTLDMGFIVPNVAPAVDLNGAAAGTGSTLAYTENQAATALAAAATVSDADSADFNGGSLRVAFTANGTAADQLTIGNQGTGAGQIGVSGSTITYGGATIGTFAGGANGADLVITFTTASATAAAAQALVRDILYANSSDSPSTTARTVTFTLIDGDGTDGGSGNDTGTAVATVTITAVDDAPVAVADSGATTETAATSGNVITNDTDVDGGPKAVTAVNGVGASVGTQITLASGALLTVNADGTYSYNPNGKFNYLVSPATAAATGAVNGTATDSFTYTLNGGSTATVTVTITGVDGAGDQLRGDAGNNTITGTPQPDVFNLSQGGDDTVSGGAGDDGFYFGAALTATDTVDGQGGTLDQLGLQGNYAGLTFGANTIKDIENIVLLSYTDTRFGGGGATPFSYNLTTNDGNTAAGQYLAVSANTLKAGESVTFDARAELDGGLIYYGGAGTDVVTGSQTNDGFFFQFSAFGAGDVVDGQGGDLDQLALQGGFNGTIGGGQLISIENLVLISSHNVRFPSSGAYNYTVTLSDGNVLAGHSFAVSANQLAADETLVLDARAESDAAITVYSGAGNDTIRMGAMGDTVFGGAGNDTIEGNGGADKIYGGAGADQLSGGTGADTFFYLAVGDSTASAQDHILDFATGDHIDLASIRSFSLVSGGFTAANQVRVTNQGNGDYLVEAETTGDGQADMSILVTSDHALTASDFVGVTGASPDTFHPPVTPSDVIAGPVQPDARIGIAAGTDDILSPVAFAADGGADAHAAHGLMPLLDVPQQVIVA